MEPVQPQGGRHGKRTYRYRRGAGNARRHLGGKRTRLVDAAVCLRQDRRRLRNGKYQLQTGRAGISVRELGYAHALYRQRRKRQRLRADDLHHAAGTEELPARTSEKRAFSLYEECHLRRAGKTQRNVQHFRDSALRQ